MASRPARHFRAGLERRRPDAHAARGRAASIGHLRVVALDATRPESVAPAFEACGPIDVLVNNAGHRAHGRLRGHADGHGAKALEAAAVAGRFDVVVQLPRELRHAGWHERLKLQPSDLQPER